MNSGMHSGSVDTEINDNKRRIKLLTDINSQLTARRSQENKVKSLKKEAEELEKELRGAQQKVNRSWQEKIQVEKVRSDRLEEELKDIMRQIKGYADTPGYHQAQKHSEVQSGVYSKSDGPSTRGNYKNMASRLQSEIKDLQERVNKTKLKLISEIKEKTALEEEVREMRASMSVRRSVTPSRFMAASIPDLNLSSSRM